MTDETRDNPSRETDETAAISGPPRAPSAASRTDREPSAHDAETAADSGEGSRRAGSDGRSGRQSASSGTPYEAPLAEQPGDEIGPYLLLEPIGKGGFGRVWRAERRHPFVQTVALKILLADASRADLAARFLQERQALALLNHPNIVQVYDGGITPQGLPYFTMEFVKGETLVRYCDRHKLSLRARLDIFVQICDAVQHAHMRGILHRDLKPANILVTASENGAPRPVVIDFGIAKTLAAKLTDEEIFTARGDFIGTPEYMSPEQAEQLEGDIDTRTDVYSLGVVLYELLVSEVPFSASTIKAVGRAAKIDAMRRMIREQDPPRPSTKLSRLSDRSAEIATARQMNLEQLAVALRGELEWIPLKALRKDRTQRYRSAAELGDDVRNWMAGRPLIAGPESGWYRARKFVRRNKKPVAAVAAVAASLVAGTVVSVLGWSAAAEQRDLALERERETRAVLDFQESQLSNIAQAEAGVALFGEIERRMRAALETSGTGPTEAARRVDDFREALQLVNPTDVAFSLVRGEMLGRSESEATLSFGAAPLLQSSLFMTLGRTAHTLADHERALGLFKLALERRSAILGPNDPSTLEAREWILRVPVEGDKEAFFDEANAILEARRAALGDEHPAVRDSLRTVAGLHADFGEIEQSIEWYARAAERSSAADANSVEAIRDMVSLGNMQREHGQLAESEKTLRDARTRIDLTKDCPDRLRAEVLNNLSLTLTSFPNDPARTQAGLALLREVAEIDRRVDGTAHPNSFDSASNLGLRLAATPGGAEEGGGILRASWNEARNLPYRSNSALFAINDYATWFFEHGAKSIADPAERERELRAMLEATREVRRTLLARATSDRIDEARDARLVEITHSLAMKHLALAEPELAEPLLREATEARIAQLEQPGHFLVQGPRRDLALAIAAQGRWQESIELLVAAQADAERDLPEISEGRWVTACRLLRFLEAWRARGGPAELDARIEAQKTVLARLTEAQRKAGLAFEIDRPSHAVP